MEAVAVASLLSSTGAAVAGTGTFLGMSAATLGAISGIASAGGALMSGLASRQEAKIADRQMQLQATTARLQAGEDDIQRRRALLSTIATQNSLYSSRGVRLGSGTPTTMRNQVYDEVNRGTVAGNLNLETNLSDINLKRYANRSRANSSFTGSLFDAATTVADTYDRYKKIGDVPKTAAGS